MNNDQVVDLALNMAQHQFGVTRRQLLRRNNKRPLTFFRHIVMAWLAKDSKMNLDFAARAMNRVEHSSIIYARNQVNNYIETGDMIGNQALMFFRKCDHMMGICENTEEVPSLENISVVMNFPGFQITL